MHYQDNASEILSGSLDVEKESLFAAIDFNGLSNCQDELFMI